MHKNTHNKQKVTWGWGWGWDIDISDLFTPNFGGPVGPLRRDRRRPSRICAEAQNILRHLDYVTCAFENCLNCALHNNVGYSLAYY